MFGSQSEHHYTARGLDGIPRSASARVLISSVCANIVRDIVRT